MPMSVFDIIHIAYTTMQWTAAPIWFNTYWNVLRLRVGRFRTTHLSTLSSNLRLDTGCIRSALSTSNRRQMKYSVLVLWDWTYINEHTDQTTLIFIPNSLGRIKKMWIMVISCSLRSYLAYHWKYWHQGCHTNFRQVVPLIAYCITESELGNISQRILGFITILKEFPFAFPPTS